MAMSSWMIRRSNRSARYNAQVNKDDYVKLDLNKDPKENTQDVLVNISKTSGISNKKHLNYLNAFVKLIVHVNKNDSHLGYCTEEILCCLRVLAINEATQVRSGAFRAIRYLLNDEQDVTAFNNLLYPFILVRSLDLMSDIEKIESMKLSRKILSISASRLDISIARSLVSLASGGIEDKDRMLRVYLATLSEIGILNHELFIAVGGVSALTRNLLECQTPRIAESICGILLMLLDKPSTRYQAAVDLHCVAAPYCDFHYRHGWLDANREERETRFTCSRLALLSIFRSWPGVLHFCSPINISGLKAIVDVLYLNQLEVRKAVLDLLYDLLGLPQPEWTDELSVALAAVDPAELQPSWRINEGFVAAEGRSVLPHLSRTTPNIIDQHLSLLLYCFVETGLITALGEVIATSDTFISVRATVLLGELLRLIQILLPPECCNITPALPNLIEYAVRNVPQALHAITALQQLHKLLKRRPASSSLYLDYILQSGSFFKSSSRVEKLKRHKSSFSKTKLFVLKEGDDDIKESGVLQNKDFYMWNWNQIRLILAGEKDINFDMTESSHRSFFKRLVEFYLPSKNKYSHMDLTTPKNSQGYTIVGLLLLDCLLKIGTAESMNFLFELFADISSQIAAITDTDKGNDKNRRAHDCLFSPQHMADTQCQTYFLFIGRFGATPDGMKLLDDMKIYDKLRYLATSTNHECYVKLIVSSLDYKDRGPARDILAAILTCPNENTRLYATQFLLVLLRAGLPRFNEWGIKLLTKQLRDQSRSVYLSALNTLHEATEIPSCLETLVQTNPPLIHLGEKGVLLLIRFFSITRGYELLNRNNFVANEIRRWDEYFNYKYVKLIESEISDSLTLHQRGDDGRYDKRTSSGKSIARKDVFLPPHLYGQLSIHSKGLRDLLECGSTEKYIQLININACETDAEILNLKAALWALGHLGSTNNGLDFINSKNVLATMVSLAEASPVFSVRATAFYTLGLIATTKKGADNLFKLGWVCSRHDRHDRWPIIEEENWECLKAPENNFYVSTSSESERISSELPITRDFCVPDEDSSTTDDDLLLAADATLTPYQRSLTLPSGQHPYSSQHQRSLSESKTFDIFRNYEQKGRPNAELHTRHRDNSITESTTSGVSSCDSMLGKNVITNDKPQALSPIPSSSSLITIKNTSKLRRYSESNRRNTLDQSLTPSDKSTISPSGSGKLSYQDLIGMSAVRSLQMSRRVISVNEDNSQVGQFTRVNSLDRKPRSIFNYFEQDFTNHKSYLYSEISLSSLSSVQKYSVKDSTRGKEKCYMGICLPVVLVNIFPENVAVSRLLSYENEENVTIQEHELNIGSSNSARRNIFPHVTQACLKCRFTNPALSQESPNKSTSKANEEQVEETSTIRFTILKEIERMSNPIIMKPAKQALAHCKERHPQAFQDLCLYSDACKMISENSYRLGPRRFIHELFWDVDYSTFYEHNQRILNEEKEQRKPSSKSDGDAGFHSSNKNQLAAIASYALASSGMKERERELSSGNHDSNVSGGNSRVIRGFAIDKSWLNEEDNEDSRLSPTKCESRSPPLTSVQEENTSSTENLHIRNKDEERNCKTDANRASLPSLKTLDSLRLTYNENKFPIRPRVDRKIIQ